MFGPTQGSTPKSLSPAEEEKVVAETRKLRAEAEKAEHDAESARINVEERVRKLEEEAAGDYRHRVYHFTSEVSDTSVESCVSTLNTWARLYPGEEITVKFYSPGGNVLAGWMLYDTMRRLSDEGHHITTVIAGVAASMAGVLVQAGDTRLIGRNSFLHLHEVSLRAMGKLQELKDSVRFGERLTRQVAEVYAQRSTLSADEIEQRMKNTELYLSAEEALELGFVDKIIS